jgi:hypothetical protein
MNATAARTAREAAAVTKVALVLVGHELDPFTWQLTFSIGRGGVTVDYAVEAIVGRFVGGSSPG